MGHVLYVYKHICMHVPAYMLIWDMYYVPYTYMQSHVARLLLICAAYAGLINAELLIWCSIGNILN